MSVPAVGTPAPDFELMTDSRELFRLSAHKGQMVVLYFYPQDDTEGCTLENIEFTDFLPEFKALKAAVVGISPDTIEKHCTFRDKYNLGVPLASDPDRTVISAYGLWQLKKLYGVEFMGVKRATVLIDAEGSIAEVLFATRIKGHAEKVLAAARSLSDPANRVGKTTIKTKR